ncbi:RDD family protein [Actinoplanes xinjiangensis]|uniref:Putative RDD family membrane protein YckC n=1 Tax=Actinoplanes xinjiangensis TaxID=512350 RepID=A0A316ECZ4_9ACTN|nr:RDD family protein [Actinoplanes xinjiangensis]PWK27245.1 putative RDD family membrane protein YckC [Actinoplanes xinjiangensis]GIF45300.1 transporter [Actinoplanes xinjiangensis]
MLTVRVLTTAEAVEIDVRPARLGSRAIALSFDILMQAVVFGFLAAVYYIVLDLLPASYSDLLLPETAYLIGIAIVAVGYPTTVETVTNGRSFGKLVMGLRVIREDGGPIRARHAFTRALVGLAVEWPGLLLPLITWAGSLATMIGSRRGRRLGDLAAGTLVVHERRPVPWNLVPGMPAGLALWAADADLSAVDDDLAEAIRQFAARSFNFAEPYRSILGQSLHAEVKAKVTPPPPTGTPPWLFLVAVLAERRRRSAAQLAATRAVTQRVLPGFGQLPAGTRR